jgi:hypothetical protein
MNINQNLYLLLLKIIFLRFLIKSISSSTGNITCFPSVTGYYNGNGNGANNYYVDIIICKWVFNGVDYNDRSTTAKSDCSKAGTSYSLESQTYISYFQTNPTNDSAMINKYISSSACER